MESKNELTAFIPVDRAVALKRNPKNSWKMSARALYRRPRALTGQGGALRSGLGGELRDCGEPDD